MSTDNYQTPATSSRGFRRFFEAFTPSQPVPEQQCRKRASTIERRERSKSETPIANLPKYAAEVADGDHEKSDTVLYLAYGSNLCYETFQGRRKVQPLSQLNVVVPELRMTFDLPGIPYTEPCFANTARRDPTGKPNPAPGGPEFHKDRWRKGLVGVVYEVTPSDYAHIIATEGGGANYNDILVDCYALDAGSETVPETPTGAPFKAHTLFAPYNAPSPPPPPQTSTATRAGRPDPAYAQPSARYLKLISDGAKEHGIPQEYQEYLNGIRPYTITTQAQRVGQFVFMTLWLPFVLFYFGLTRLFQDPKTGVSPPWLAWLGQQLFGAVWRSYDNIFKQYFGDGERTIGDDKDLAQVAISRDDKSALDGSFSSWRRGATIKDERLAEKLV